MQYTTAIELQPGQHFRFLDCQTICLTQSVIQLGTGDNIPESDRGKTLICYEQGGRCRQYVCTANLSLEHIPGPFYLIQNRKPWNQASEWLLLQILFLIEGADSFGLITVEQFNRRLQGDFVKYCEKAGKKPTTIAIQVWDGVDKKFLGVDKANSLNGAAFTVTTIHTTP